MKYLIVTIEGGGNIPPILFIVRKLILQGHSVYILSEPWFKELAEKNGATFIPYREYLTKTDRKLDIVNDWKDKNNAFNVIFGSADIVANETKEAIRNHQIEAVIVDVLTPGGLIGAEVMKVPRALLFHMPEYLPALNRPPGGLGLVPINNSFGRIWNRILGKVFNVIFDKYLPQINKVREKNNLKKLNHITEMFHAADLRIIQTSKAFDFPILPAPENVRYTGPVLDDPDWVEEWNSPWTKDDRRPLVIVSLSSTFQNQRQVIENCIIALSRLKVRGLVTLGPAMEEEMFQAFDNVKVVKSVSHAQVFPHASCIVTHAGHGTVMRALANGIPIVCLPMGRDQDDNAAKVAYYGAGIKLSPKASHEKIGKAVSQILSNKAFRENAVNLGAAVKKEANGDSLINALEELVS